MGKQVNLFLVTALAGVLLCAAVIYWIGWPLVRLAFLDPDRDQPLTVINLVDARGLADFSEAYQRPLENLLASEGGELLDHFRLQHLLHGGLTDEWQFLNVMTVPVGTNLVQLMTSAQYRALAADQTGLRRRMLATYATPLPRWRDGLVMWMLAERAESSDAFSAMEKLAVAGGGRLVLDSVMMQLDEEVPFNRLILIDFPTAQAASIWLRNETSSAERALLNARVNHMAVAIFSRGPSA